MIQLIQAPPRSGKTFYAVNYLMRFVELDELYQEYIVKDDVLIISNIEGLKIRHWTLDYCLKEQSLEQFFSIENFEAIQKKTRKTHIILVIDEAHELFPPSYKSDSICRFFAFHGHIGLDIFLLTQGISLMTRMFNPMLEYVVCCKPRSKKIANFFSYDYQDLKGLHLYNKRLTAKKSVFAAYKSFRHDEHNKPRSAVTPLIIGIVCLFCFAFYLFSSSLSTLGSGSRDLASDVSGDVENVIVDTSVSSPRDPVVSVSVDTSPASVIIPVTGSIYLKGKLYVLTKFGRVRDFIRFDRAFNTVEVSQAMYDKLSFGFVPSTEESHSSDYVAFVPFAPSDPIENTMHNTPLNLIVDQSELAERLNNLRVRARVNLPLKPPES